MVGDANGKAMLAHTAFKEAEIAVANICGGQRTMRYDCIPSCIYMEPEIASVGLTETQARERCGDDVKIGRFPLYANGKSLIDGGTDGMMKVILDSKYGEILGVHLFGAHTTEMIAQFATAMQSELTAEEVLETVFPHPSVSEGLGEAFLEMSRNVQSGNPQNLKSMVIQRSFPKWSVAERRKTAAASNQAAVCACAHSRYFTGGSPSGLRV